MHIEKLQSALNRILTGTPFATDAAKKALLALVQAGPDIVAFTNAIEPHREFWRNVEPSLLTILAEEAPTIAGDQKKAAEAQEAYAILQLWANAARKLGQDDLSATEFLALGKVLEGASKQLDELKKSEHWTVLVTKNKPIEIIELQNTHQKNENLRKTNISKFAAAIKNATPDPKGKQPQDNASSQALTVQGQSLLDIIQGLSLTEQKSILAKLKDKTFLEKLSKAKDPADFTRILGVKLSDKQLKGLQVFFKPRNDDPEKANTEMLRVVLYSQEFLDSSKIPYSIVQKNIILGLFDLLPAERQLELLHHNNRNNILKQIFQAQTAGDVEKYLGLPPHTNQSLVNALVNANITYISREQGGLLKYKPINNVEKPPTYNNPQYTKLLAYYKFLLRTNIYESFIKAVSPSDLLTDAATENLVDAFILSPNLEAFKKNIANQENFDKLLSSKHTGGIFGDYLPGKKTGYQLRATDTKKILESLENMTEAEFSMEKARARKSWISQKNNLGTVAAETEKYLRLDQDVTLDAIDADFNIIRKQLSALKETLNPLRLSIPKDTSGNLYIQHLLEAVSNEKGTEFKKTIENALEEGTANVNALKRLEAQLVLYRESLNPDKGLPAQKEQIEWLDKKIREVKTETRKLEGLLNPFKTRKEANQGILAKIESTIINSTNTSVRLEDDTDLWETFITAVDPAYKPNANVISENDETLARVSTQAPKVNKNRYEDIPKPGEVLEYVVRKKPDSDKVNGIFRKERTPNLKNPSKENISIEIMALPEDVQGRVLTAMRATAEFLKTHVKGQPIVLSGRDTQAIADLYFSLLKHGVSKDEITFAPNCTFDPDKHRTFHFWYKSESPTGKSEDYMKENDEIIKSSVKSLNQYQEAHGNAGKILDDVAKKAQKFSDANKAIRNSMEHKAQVAEPEPAKAKPGPSPK